MAKRKAKKPMYPQRIFINGNTEDIEDFDGYVSFTDVNELGDGVVLEYTLTAVLNKTTESRVTVEPL